VEPSSGARRFLIAETVYPRVAHLQCFVEQHEVGALTRRDVAHVATD
jgi:hypothetical protein